ncbi:MAG: GH3 auxin-responsive promoter family protein, partial [Gammaproteobacteria bacterium]|nr:GH3 auxin-responsive promoter family protein [Gammaproteobacteria bacterium]
MRGPYLQILTEHLSGTTPGGIPTGAVTTGGIKSMGGFADMIMSSPGDVARIHDQTVAR